jgi:hypothetical protein
MFDLDPMLCKTTISAASLSTRSRSRRLLIAAIGMSLALGTEIEAQAQDEVIYWARPEFIIPFQVDPNGVPPREVILEASEDLGRTWYVVSRGDVRTRQFRFSSPKNGDFLFRLKMVDDSGRTFSNPGEPLHICVDTDKPTAKLSIEMDHYGDLNARISISDQNLDQASITLDFQIEDSDDWEPIPFDLQKQGNSSDWTGYGTWSIPQTARQIKVRLKGRDKAGNAFEVIRTPNIPKTAVGRNGFQLASKPNRYNESELGSSGATIGSGAAKSADSMPKGQVLAQPSGVPAQPLVDSLGAQQQLIDNQQKLIEQLLNQQRQVSTAKSLEPTFSLERTGPMDSRGAAESGLILAPNKSSPVRLLSDEELRAINERMGREPTAPRVAEMGHRWQGGQTAPWLGSNTLSSPTLDATSLPPSGLPISTSPSPPMMSEPLATSTVPLFSGSRAFSLEYGIEDDLGVPVRTVELWGTVDGGKTWEYWGDDLDRASPFDIEVESDGLFGFRMVIVGNNGLAQNRPRNGDDADAWVKVDTQPPRLRLQSALYGRGPEAGSLIIEYLASDPNFGERPISLYYSSTTDGPWQEIATSLKNSGRYVWPANPSLPPEIYIKIKAFDAAGNLAEHVMDIPVKVQGIAPRGRIHGISGGPRTSAPGF